MNALKTAWNWLSVSKNQKTLSLIGAALIFVWQVYLHLSETPKESTKAGVTVVPNTTIEQSTKSDVSAAVIVKVPLDHKNVVQKTEGKNSPAIISNGDVSINSEK